jgi:hypothetical protein
LQSLVASETVTGLTWGEPPQTVMNTALTTSGNITITFPDDYSYRYILSFYYAELNSTANASSRIFYLKVPGNSGGYLMNPYSDGLNSVFNGLLVMFSDSTYTRGTDIVLYPDQTTSSPLGPIANALEFWQISTNSMAPVTENQDGELLIWL